MGGVPSEPRFQNLTDNQWAILISHYLQKKSRDRDDIIEGIEYLAMLVSINPKAVMKIASARKKQKAMAENQKDEDYLTVNKDGENELGHFVNTTFYKDLAKFGGDEILDKLDNPKDYKVEVKEEEDTGLDDEDDRFLREAKKMMAEREKELEEEAKFKEEHPELFGADEIILE